MNAISLLQHVRSTYEVSKLLDTSQSTCSRECIPHVGYSRGGCPRSITPAQEQVCVIAITVGELNYVVDVRNTLSEHLKVVVSTNTSEASSKRSKSWIIREA